MKAVSVLRGGHKRRGDDAMGEVKFADKAPKAAATGTLRWPWRHYIPSLANNLRVHASAQQLADFGVSLKEIQTLGPHVRHCLPWAWLASLWMTVRTCPSR